MFADGFAIPLEPLKLALDLEARGCSLERIGDDLLVRPRSLLTDEDRDGLRRWKSHVLAIVERCEAIQ
jgi:hypothetical protein